MPERSSASIREQPALVWAALAVVYVLWGSTYFGIRVAVETMPPFLMAGMRFVIAGLILLAWRLPSAIRSGATPTADAWRRATIIGAALLLGGNGMVAYAEQTVPSGPAALIVAVVPLWMALIDRVFYGKKVSGLAVAGLVVGFAGVALLVAGRTGSVPPLGAFELAIGSLSWAAGSLYSRGAKLPDDSLLSTGMQMTAGGLLLVFAALLTGELKHVDVASISAASWWAFVYLVFFGGIAGFGAYLWVIRNAPTSLVSTYAYVNPLIAVLLGSLFLHETFDVRMAAATAVIVAGVAAIVTARKPIERL